MEQPCTFFYLKCLKCYVYNVQRGKTIHSYYYLLLLHVGHGGVQCGCKQRQPGAQSNCSELCLKWCNLSYTILKIQFSSSGRYAGISVQNEITEVPTYWQWSCRLIATWASACAFMRGFNTSFLGCLVNHSRMVSFL